jgi:hypothetical protein
LKFNVTKAEITVTPNDGQTKVYGGTEPTLTYAVSGAKNGETAAFNGTLSRNAGESAADYAIVQNNLALKDNGTFKAANYTLKFVTGKTLKSTKATSNAITGLSCASVVYGGTPAPSISGASFGMGTQTYSYSSDGTTFGAWSTSNPAGEYTVKVSIPGTADYVGAEATLKFNVTKAEITVTPNDGQTKVYGGTEPTLTYEVSGAKNGETAAFNGTLSRNAGESAADYAIVQNNLALKDNGSFKAASYTLKFVTGKTFKVTKATSNAITGLSCASIVYGGTPAPSISGASFGMGTQTYSYSNNGTTFSAWSTSNPVGEYTVKATVAETSNYVGAEATLKFNVTKAEITVTPNSQSMTYRGTEPDLTYAVSGVKNGEPAAFNGELSRDEGDIVGEYEIRQNGLSLRENGAFKTANYTMTFVTGKKFTITKATNNVITGLSCDDFDYGSGIPTPSISGASFGMGTQTYSYSSDGINYGAWDVNNLAGTYTLRVTIPETNNYAQAQDFKTFKVNRLAIEVTPTDGIIKGYGTAEDPDLTYTYRGQKQDEAPAFTGKLSRSPGEDAKQYEITKGTLALADNGSFKAANYKINFVSGKYFEILKATSNAIGGLKCDSIIIGGTPNPTITSATYGGGTVQYTYSVDNISFKPWSEITPAVRAYIVKAKIPETSNYVGFATTTTFKVLKAQYAVAGLQCADVTFGSKPTPSINSATAGAEAISYTYSSDGLTFGEWNENNPAGTYILKAAIPETETSEAIESETTFTVKKAAIDGEVTIKGEPQYGSTLKADNISFKTPDGKQISNYTYQWQRLEPEFPLLAMFKLPTKETWVDIPNAQGETYVIDSKDVGKKIKLKVTIDSAKEPLYQGTAEATT